MTASMIQSQSATRPRSSSKLPGVIRGISESTKKPPGRCLAAFSMPFSAAAFRFGAVRDDDVQQNGRNTGIGKMRGDSRAHGAGSEDGHPLDSSHVSSQMEFSNSSPDLRRGLNPRLISSGEGAEAMEAGTDAERLMKDAALRLLEEDARFRAAVREGIAQADRGEFIEEEEMDARLDQMLRS